MTDLPRAKRNLLSDSKRKLLRMYLEIGKSGTAANRLKAMDTARQLLRELEGDGIPGKAAGNALPGGKTASPIH